jgi:hypothetical protein
MTNRRITSQPWLIKAAAEGTLGTIILPLEGLQPKQQPDGTWNYKETWWGESGPHPDYLDEITDFQLSDRIYLAEKWCKGDWGAAFDDDIYFVESATPEAEHIGWQPAETMPEEAAQYWFEITEVKATQAKYLDYFTIGKTGFYNSYPDATYPSEEFKNAWDKAHPEHLWSGANWVIAMEVRAISQ